MSDVQVLGLCRWSYPAAPQAFKGQFGSEIGEIRKAVYAPERLETRLFLLENVVIPCLKAQTDQDFRIVMLLGETLPEPWRGRLMDLISGVPQIEPVFAAEGQQQMALCHKVMKAARNRDIPVSAEFRCDDDDAVAVDFVARTRAQFRILRRLYEDDGKLALDFSSGFLMQAAADGDMEFQSVVARQWTPALVQFLPSDREPTLAKFHHARLWRRMTILSWPRKPMFVRGAHPFNVSSVNRKPANAEFMDFDPLKLPEICRERFGIDVFGLADRWKEHCREVLPGKG